MSTSLASALASATRSWLARDSRRTRRPRNTLGKTTSTSLTGLVTYGISSNGNVDPNNTQLNAYGDITLTGTAEKPGTLASQNTSQNAIRWGTSHTMASTNGNITINAVGQLDWLSSQTLTLAAGKALIYNSGFNGTWGNVIRFMPPLVVDESEMATAVDAVAAAVAATA